MTISTAAPERTLRQQARVRVLVDEAHQQAWTIRPELAARMAPSHPGDSSYARAAGLLDARDFAVRAHADGPLDAAALREADLVVIAHPSEPRWEATTGSGSPLYSDDERAALVEFVAAGGGLVVLTETEQDKYGTNLDALLAAFGVRTVSATVQDYVEHHRVPSWIFGSPTAGTVADRVFHGVGQACFYRAGVLETHDGAGVLARTSATADPAGAGLVAAVEHGAGRVVVFADSDLFGDDCLTEFDHARLWLNTCYWAALPAFRREVAPASSPLLDRPAWAELLAATDELRLLQAGSGSRDGSVTDTAPVAPLVGRIAAALGELAADLPHDAAYLAAAAADLRRWLDGGCAKPDFGASLTLFRPEQLRRDGIEHVVLFPMYTPNNSLEVRFEALLVRVPWPAWADELERSGFDNAKFVPVHLLGSTAGYASECAVLFPETVSVAGPAANTFGGIFCDREAARFRRVTARAVSELAVDVPPRVEALLADESLLRDAFLLWDLVHDRAHSHGDLPFDPFMIRQRLPYWMYALEELRCDLTAFRQAGELARTFAFAEHVQTAVLFDRMLRFPVTGTRVRNYDGLGGQILFGFLHKRGVVRWSDNQLVIDWDALPAGVDALAEEIAELYRRGIESSRVRYWIDAHDLVSRYVTPNLASRWTPEARVDGPEESDFKGWVDRVHGDEFPLNMFFRILGQRLAPVLA